MIKTKNLNLVIKDKLQYIQFPKLCATGAVNHLFSTRHGGVSEGEFSSMNLSFNRGDKRENVIENYKILCNAENIDFNKLTLSHQTHTNNVVIVGNEDIGRGISKESFSDVDGLITNIPGVALVTQYADCTPLLFCDPIKKVCATSHAGWRGTVQQIGKVTIEKMVSEFGCNPKDIVVGIGPSIKQCCYEVDDPVYNAFSELKYINPDDIFIKKANGKYMLDLVKANFLILVNAGVNPENIDCSDVCTNCYHEDLHSHRATAGKRGNLAAIISLKEENC